MRKQIITSIIFFVFGACISGLFLWNQIENRYKIGHNAGILEGKFQMMDFLKKNVQNTSENTKELDIHFQVKYADISVIEINGIKTVIITE